MELIQTIFKFTIYINEKGIILVCARLKFCENFMNSYQKFVGAAFQMLITILLGVWLGQYLDGYFHLGKPWCTIGFSLGSIALSMYALIKSLPK
jgi:F0F1-type ATP synthase assembly protein I